MNTALVAFRGSEGSLQIEVVDRKVQVVTPREQTGKEGPHRFPHVAPYRVGAALVLSRQDIKVGTTLFICAIFGLK
jgi:hypothetical protein